MTASLAPRRRRRPPARGSALITVILVVLILTVVGIGIAYFTQVEDRISGNDRLAKTSFYAAETGLRTGEEVLANYSRGGNPINTLLNASAPSGVFNPPGGGAQAKSFRVGSITYLNRDVPRLQASADSGSAFYLRAQYSLYIRNNVEDRGLVTSGVPDPGQDADNKVNLIAVGSVLVNGQNAVTRVLEEQLELTNESIPYCLQADCDPGSTGSIAK
jgi:hypothetical protein